MKYILTGEGDNSYEHKFATLSGVYSFLYTILENIELRHWETSNMFDIEDDKITLSSPEGIFSCNGWHWYEEHKELLMPDGESFYSKASKLYN